MRFHEAVRHDPNSEHAGAASRRGDHPGLRAVRPALLGSLVAGAVLLLMTPAIADVTVHLTENGEARTMYLSSDKLRMEGEGEVLIFDGKAEVMYMIDPAKKSYRKMDKKQMKAMGESVQSAMGQRDDALEDAMKMMEEKMKDLTPEQRAMMEKYLPKGGVPSGGNGAAGSPILPTAPSKSYAPNGKTEKINGWKCEGYSISEDGQPAGEVWVANPKEMGISKDDLSAFGKMRSFFEELASQMGVPIGDQFDEMNLFDPSSESFIGVPVRQTDDGVTEVTSVEKGKIDGDRFRVPSGYELDSSGMMGTH